ncbi:MAG: HlyD family type I secretion periplasmic adaptor subunit [Rhodospirillales bacterium]|nr:MAG: HlyD family type I secretion periplasmic adaptor subunit [Rhodospirillales bacterium]
MSRLDRILIDHPLPTWRPVVWGVMAFFAVFLAWAGFGELDQVAVAPGEVIPQTRVKVVQHLEGGIIEAIHVREGELVSEGQPLVQLDLGAVGLNREELTARLDGEMLRRARLAAEVAGADLVLPADAAARQAEVAHSETETFEARRRELVAAINVAEAQVAQRELQVLELEARQRTTRSNLALARERLRLSGSLLASGLTARMEHLQLQAEVEGLEGELETLEPAIPRARAAVTEARERLEETRTRFRREAQEQLAATDHSIARVREVLAQATRQDVRAEVRSPIDGVVKNIRYATIGGVVAPGEPIMEIVPTGDRLVVEAKLSPTDRGYVAEGQRAVVKVTAYDFVRYGGLDGTVVAVAPDTSIDRSGLPSFRLTVETDKTYLGDTEGSFPITPGMQATVDVHTGTRSVLHYLVRPVLKLRDEAFRER